MDWRWRLPEKEPGKWFVWLGYVAVIFSIEAPGTAVTKASVLVVAFVLARLELRSIHLDRERHDQELATNRAEWAQDRQAADARHAEQLERFETISQVMAEGFAADAQKRELVAAGSPPNDPTVLALAQTASESWAVVSRMQARWRDEARTRAQTAAAQMQQNVANSRIPFQTDEKGQPLE